MVFEESPITKMIDILTRYRCWLQEFEELSDEEEKKITSRLEELYEEKSKLETMSDEILERVDEIYLPLIGIYNKVFNSAKESAIIGLEPFFFTTKPDANKEDYLVEPIHWREQLSRHLQKIEPMVKKFAQIRGYMTIHFPTYSGRTPHFKLYKVEDGIQSYIYFLIERMDNSVKDKLYDHYEYFFETLPYCLGGSVKGLKSGKREDLLLYEEQPFKEIQETILDDLFLCDFKFEKYKRENLKEFPVKHQTPYQICRDPDSNLKELNVIVEQFSKEFNYKYESDFIELCMEKVRLFKTINGVLYNIILRPYLKMGEHYYFSEDALFTLQCSTSLYEVDENGLQSHYQYIICYEKRAFKDIEKSFYEDLVWCNRVISKGVR